MRGGGASQRVPEPGAVARGGGRGRGERGGCARALVRRRRARRPRARAALGPRARAVLAALQQALQGITNGDTLYKNKYRFVNVGTYLCFVNNLNGPCSEK